MVYITREHHEVQAGKHFLAPRKRKCLLSVYWIRLPSSKHHPLHLSIKGIAASENVYPPLKIPLKNVYFGLFLPPPKVNTFQPTSRASCVNRKGLCCLYRMSCQNVRISSYRDICTWLCSPSVGLKGVDPVRLPLRTKWHSRGITNHGSRDLKYPVSKHSQSLGGIKCLPVTIFRNPHRGGNEALEHSSKGIARQQWDHTHCLWSAKKRLLSGCFQGCKSKRFSGVPLSAGRQAYVSHTPPSVYLLPSMYYPHALIFQSIYFDQSK